VSKRTKKVVRRATRAFALAASVLAADAVTALVGQAFTAVAQRGLQRSGKKHKKKRR
jgi:hypothetical protein